MQGRTKAMPSRSRFKFRNTPTEVDGIRFASKREAKRFSELKLLANAGKISGLHLQVPFEIKVNGQHICDYLADFTYRENGQLVVEDSKGFRTRDYRLKAKLVKAVYGIVIKEV